ncbi:MAG: HD-GYP domain-containing protein [Thermotogota bacterium]|nr:HD-GYP domain-containing protein [Thermotogota bacterium]
MFITLTFVFLSLSIYLLVVIRSLKSKIKNNPANKEELKRLISKVDELTVSSNEAEMETQKLYNTVELYENVIQAASRLIEMASQSDSDETFLRKLLEESVAIIPEADYGSVVLMKDDDWRYVHAIGHDFALLNSLELKREFFLDPRTSDDTMYFDSNVFVINGIERRNYKLPDDIYPIFYKATKRTFQTAIMEIDIGEDIAGTIALDTSQKSESVFSNESLKMFGALGNIAATFMAFQRLNQVHEEFQKEIILSNIRMMEIHDEYTRGHSEMVAELSREIAVSMGYDEETIKEVYWSGLVHDIGKILIPGSILNKPGKLSSSEFDIIKKHPVWGYEVLKQSKYLSKIALNVRFHHERYDGGGYPDSLKGDEIPPISKILSVADTWDAMTRNRAYRKALDLNNAIKEMEQNKGKQFDPQIVEVFLLIIKQRISEGKAVD